MKWPSRELVLGMIVAVLGGLWVFSPGAPEPGGGEGPGEILPSRPGPVDHSPPRPPTPVTKPPAAKEISPVPQPKPVPTPKSTSPRPGPSISPASPLHQRVAAKLGLDLEAPEGQQLQQWLARAAG